MLNRLFIERVTERDIDLLLLEEFECNMDFRNWFLKKVGLDEAVGADFAGVWHSVTEGELGESDLILYFDSKVSGKLAAMIENKIDAPMQPDQAERYDKRGNIGIEKGHWSKFVTCIVAPECYLAAIANHSFGYQVSYEEIAEWFSSNSASSCRMSFRSKIFKEAVEENRRSYQVIEDPIVAKFWQQYRQVAEQDFKYLGMKKRGKRGSQAIWPEFSPSYLPEGKGIRLIHKMQAGNVELMFSGRITDFEHFKNYVSELLEDGMSIEQRDQSTSVCIKVPVIDKYKAFIDQQESVLLALEAATRLASWYAKVKDNLIYVLSSKGVFP
ncbi:MAG TPA: hypothetical protein VHT73_14020 [Thermodesulfobacteriota bacterium]|nr:hypothetical protein [Thermodesulfobacteriota bacterium]